MEVVILLLIFQKGALTETLIKLVEGEEIIFGPSPTARTFEANTLASLSLVTSQKEQDQSFVNFGKQADELG